MAVTSRRLLAISYCMPPMVAPRALQVSRLLNGLARRGWEMDTLCAARSFHPAPDEDARLRRTVLPEVGQRALRYRGLAGSLLPERLRRELPLGDWDERRWHAAATREALALIQRRPPAALITFAQPWSDHLAGLTISRACPTLPWVAHFSDPWVDSPYYDTLPPETLRLWREREAAVVEQARRIIFVTKGALDLVMDKYPSSWRKKARVLTHCVDPALVRDARAASPAPRATLRCLHLGAIYGRRASPALLEALARLRRHAGPALRLECVGDLDRTFLEAISRHGLEDMVRCHARVGFFQSLDLADEADVLLVMDAPARRNVFLPSKLMDYLAVGKPILGITPSQGDTAAILASLGCPTADPEDPDAIAAAFEDLLRAFAADPSLASRRPPPAGWRRFLADEVAGEFEAIMADMLPDMPASAGQ